MSSIKLGHVFQTNEGCLASVVKYINCNNVLIVFSDQPDMVVRTNATAIRRKSIKNPFHRSVEGVGYMGVGDFKAYVSSTATKPYDTWKSMMTRCYSDKYQAKQPTYVGCTVSPEWHNFQNFAKWYRDQGKPIDWCLDKDLIVRGNKEYSPVTCRLVPHEINNFATLRGRDRGPHPVGVQRVGGRFRAVMYTGRSSTYIGSYSSEMQAFMAYKDAKENHAVFLAKKYAEDLDVDMVLALINFEVMLTD